jgi:hypothetical protein
LRAAYFNCVEIDEKVVLSFVPRPFTPEMMAMEIPAAIKPYSMAVAPDSLRKKALSCVSMEGKLIGAPHEASVKPILEIRTAPGIVGNASRPNLQEYGPGDGPSRYTWKSPVAPAPEMEKRALFAVSAPPAAPHRG